MVAPISGTHDMDMNRAVQEEVDDMAEGDYSSPFVTVWAGQDGVKAVPATATRVAVTAKSIIEASTAIHRTGGRAPGMEVALQARRDAARAEAPAPELWQLEQRGISGAA